ncbi:MAG: hypothetical protein ACR2JM_07680 [Mycobacterium sp.]
MQIITLIADRITADALSTALPAQGIVAVTVNETSLFSPEAASVETYRGRTIAKHVTTAFRIEITAEDTAVDQVIAGIAFARGAGLLGDARAWISATATDLFATSSPTLAASA